MVKKCRKKMMWNILHIYHEDICQFVEKGLQGFYEKRVIVCMDQTRQRS